MSINIQRWEVSTAIKSYYMPYAMKTIVDRALADVRDGFKPVHRRILYKMNDTGAISSKERSKCATIVGEVLKIHGHGDGSVYDALAKLTAQQEGQVVDYIDGEGAFGKQYLTDNPSAMRYTFARLTKFSEDAIMGDIKKGVVKMIGSGEHAQPTVIPAKFPNILVKQNEGIAVGMSCYFPSFNLVEVCKATGAYIGNKDIDLLQYLKAPDFSTGGQIIYNEVEMRKIIDEGKGKLKVRSKYRYDIENNCIEVYEIPHNTTANAIIGQITDMIKNKVKEISDITDIRDESGFNKITKREELKIAIDVKKNTDVIRLMAYLFAKTNLEKAFTANLNCLVSYNPQTLGIKQILDYWLEFRRECISKAITFDLEKMEKELHFLKGLEKVLLDIDKVIEIIRRSKKAEITPRLIENFGIDEIQATSIRRMGLENINDEYIIEKLKGIKDLEDKVVKLKSKLGNEQELNKDIAEELKEIAEKYGKSRKSEILYDIEEIAITSKAKEVIPNYNVMFFLTKEGYFKKIPLTSLRSSGSHRLKDGDVIIDEVQGQNTDDVLVFTNIGNVYRIKAHKIDDVKTSDMGLYLPSELNLGEETIIDMVATGYSKNENVLVFYKNGYIARVKIEAYQSNYAILKGNTASEIISVKKITDDINVMLISTEGKGLIFNTSEINAVSSRNAKGVKGISLSNDIELAGVIYEPKNNVKIHLTLQKKGDIIINVKDVIYYTGSRSNVGVFAYNCRTNQDKVLQVTSSF